MARTVIDVDEDALEAAASVLGTSSKVATVNEALRRVAAESRRRAALLREMERGELYRAAADGEDEAWR